MNRDSNSSENGSDDEIFQRVTFQLENETYGINVMQVQEILRYSEIAAVPGAPDYVLGIINLRGNVVTVIDTRSRFGLMPADITDNSRIVIIDIVNTSQFKWGISPHQLDFQTKAWILTSRRTNFCCR